MIVSWKHDSKEPRIRSLGVGAEYPMWPLSRHRDAHTDARQRWPQWQWNNWRRFQKPNQSVGCHNTASAGVQDMHWVFGTSVEGQLESVLIEMHCLLRYTPYESKVVLIF